MIWLWFLLVGAGDRVGPWSSYERLADSEGGARDELLPGVAVLREDCPLGEVRREVEPLEVALQGPACGCAFANVALFSRPRLPVCPTSRPS